jgi:WD40 repeat protein
MRRRILLAVILAAGASRADAAPAADDSTAPLPAGAIARIGDPRLRPEAEPLDAAFSPDGRSLWVVTRAPTLEVWDLRTGRRMQRVAVQHPDGLKWGTRSLTLGRLSRDCRTLVIGDSSGMLIVIDSATGAPRWALSRTDKEPQRKTVSLAADGSRMAVLHEKGVTIWDLNRRKSIREISSDRHAAALTPDGERLILLSQEGIVRLLDAGTGREILHTAAPAETRRPHPVWPPVLLVPNNKTVLFQVDASELHAASLESGKLAGHIAPFPGGTVAATPGGRHVAVLTGDGVELFGVASGQLIGRLPASLPGSCSTLLSSPDGRHLAAVHCGGIWLWDLTAGRRVHASGGDGASVYGLCFFAGDRYLATGSDESLLLWDVKTARPIHTFRSSQQEMSSLWPTADGKGVVTGEIDDETQAWLVGDGPEVVHLDQIQVGASWASHSADGRWRVEFSPEGHDRLLIRRGQAQRTGRSLGKVDVQRLEFSPDSRRLVNVGQEGEVHVWSCASARRFPRFDLRPPKETWHPVINWRPDGRTVLLGDGRLQLLEVFSGQVRHLLPEDSTLQNRIELSPDGRFFARAGLDGSIHLCVPDTGEERAVWHADHAAVCSLAFSSDGRLLASGGSNGTALLWKLPQPPAARELTAATRDRLWTQLAAANARDAASAIATLSDASDAAVELIGLRLRKAWVRPARKHLEALIANLDADTFEARQHAASELEATGHAAAALLRKALDSSPSPEKERQLRRLLARLEPSAVTPERLQAVRAIEVLERIATPAARRLLDELLEQAIDPVLQEELRDSLGRFQEGATKKD